MRTLTPQEYISSKVGILEWDACVEVKRDSSGVYFVCPCGGEDHFAFRRWIPVGVSAYLSPVLNCYENAQQWLVRGIPVLGIIQREEEMYNALLDKAEILVPKIVKKRGYSQETLTFLKETHGIPVDLTQEILECPRNFAGREEQTKKG